MCSSDLYLNPIGMKTLKEEIETINDLDLSKPPRWINQKRAMKRFNNREIDFSTIVIKVRSKTLSNSSIAKEINFEGKKHTVELFQENRPEDICSKCFEFDYNSYKSCEKGSKCIFCDKEYILRRNRIDC